MKRSSLFSTAAVILFGALFLFYCAHQLYTIINNPIKTVNALYITVDDSIAAEGYFIRGEQVLGGVSGIVQYTVNPGEKVAKGAEIAEIFDDEEAASISRRIEELDERIQSIEYAKNQSVDKADAGKIDSLITMQVGELAETTDSGMVSKAYDQLKELQTLVIRRSMAEQGGVFDESALSELKVQSEALKSQVNGRMKSVKTEVSGYFSRTVDGLEDVLKPDGLDTLTVQSILALQSVSKDAGAQSVLGKVIDGFVWYFAAVVDEKEADTLSADKAVKLRFSQGPSADVTATVNRIKKDGAGKALVVFQSSAINEEIVSMRYQQVDIVKRSFKGIKVPKEAVRILNGKEGVYVVSGNQAVFKEIARLYDTGSFYIVKADGRNEKNLFIYDKIIVNAKDLNDKKVIK